ncbi:ABC transporter ATP-binding protein/permease [Leptolyngbya sp. 15MV]|nr:ABC transporter ATP-binding protein/permease [Leptolyngbya sp. 15MV]
MLRYRLMVAMALLFAIVSAGGLTAGLIGVGPVLGNILGTEGSQGLRDLAHSANQARFWPGWIDWRIPQHWIDALPTGRFTAVVVLVIGLGLLTLIGGAANFLHAFLSLTVVQRSVADIRREAFHRSVRLPLKELVGQGTQDKVSRIINDTWQLESGFTSLLSKAVSQVLKGLGALAAALIVEWRLTIAALLLAPVLYTVIRRLGKRVRRASRAAYTSTGQLMTAATEALQGLRVVKVHTTERYEAGRFHRINKDVMRQMLRARTAKALSSPLVEVLAIIVLGGLSLIAAKAIIDGKLEVDRFIVALAALFAAGASLKPLTGLLNDIQASSAAASRIREVLDAPPEPGHGKSLPRLARHAVSIEFHNVTFTYPGAARPALDRVSLRVDHGQRVAIVGPNGSGKTTLLAMIPRLFDPAEGAVRIDGVDLRDVSVRSLRAQIGVVPQETVLFRGTIRSNLA